VARKQRTQKPPSYSNYRAYKKFLRIEFDYRCAYCEVREPELGGAKSFHIDHYRPKRFTTLLNDYLNLFYTCRDCNTYKGDYWPSRWERLRKKFILNPCDHDFAEHYDRRGIQWGARTATARWNFYKLRLNSPLRMQIRDDRGNVLQTIGLLEEQLALSVKVKVEAERKKKPKEVSRMQLTINSLEKQIATQRRKIEGAMA
jgi:hypothetical protein